MFNCRKLQYKRHNILITLINILRRNGNMTVANKCNDLESTAVARRVRRLEPKPPAVRCVKLTKFNI